MANSGVIACQEHPRLQASQDNQVRRVGHNGILRGGRKDLRLLALDGGGVRGLSSLYILDRLMKTIDLENPPKPCEYFDMICGTSTGGLIAVMLGRLRMSVQDCINAYTSISEKAFRKKAHRFTITGKTRGRFDTMALENAMKRVIEDSGHDKDALLKDESGKCKVFVCAASGHTKETVCLTSYRTLRSSGYLYDTCKIWEACRATSAATTFFDPIDIGDPPKTFIDGALGMNNPVQALWNEALDVWGQRLQDDLRCIVSIGTGVPGYQPMNKGLRSTYRALVSISTETEQTAERFRRDKAHLDNQNRYFRFNVSRGLDRIGLQEWEKLSDIDAATDNYVQSQEVFKSMRLLADGLARRQYWNPYSVPFSRTYVPVSAKFVSRPDVSSRLEECLLPRQSDSQRRGLSVFVLHGSGGFGKTQLAVDFINTRRDAFSAIFWLDGRSENHLRQSIAGCIRRIPQGQVKARTSQQVETHRPDDLDADVESVLQWLGLEGNDNWLVVFDNIDLAESDTGTFNPSKYMPWGHGAVLMTTRNSRLAQLARPGHSYKLAKADRELSRQIFESWYNDKLDVEADELLNLLDGLPLALAQAASFLHETNVGIPKYVELYRQQWSKLMASHPQDSPLLDYDQGSIGTTWTVSFQRIQSEDDAAAKLLGLWGYLDKTGFSADLLIGITEGRLKWKWPSWLEDIAGDQCAFLSAIRLLARYSMIEAAHGTYSMHPVAHEWAAHLDDGHHGAENARLGLMVVASYHYVKLSTRKDSLQDLREVVPHAQRCAKRIAERTGLILPYDDRDVLYSLGVVGTLCAEFRHDCEAVALLRRAVVGCEDVFGHGQRPTLKAVANLNYAYLRLGRLHEAEELRHRLIEGYHKILGPDHRKTFRVERAMARLQWRQGNESEAIRIARDLVARSEKELPPEHPISAQNAFSLGKYLRKEAPAESEEFLKRASAGFEKLYGPHDRQRRLVLYTLGKYYLAQDRLAEAEAMMVQSMNTGGTDDWPGTKEHALEQLGRVYVRQGKRLDAEEAFRRALTGCQSILESDCKDIDDNFRNLEARLVFELAALGQDSKSEPGE